MLRAWLATAWLVAALACSDQPNVVVIMTDDQRWDSVEHMPYLSALAEQGVFFENAFVTSPLCCPSRASFLSGLPMALHRVRTNRPPLGGAPAFDPDRALPVVLQELGYRTALFGKYMNAVDALEEQPPPGWDVWHAFVEDGFNYYDYLVSEDGEHVRRSQYSTDWMADRAVEFIESSEGPFFLLYAPFAPHFNFFANVLPAERHVGAFADYAVPARPAYGEADVSDKPSFLAVDDAETYVLLQGELIRYERETLEALLAVDEAVEALIGALERRGLDRTTLVFFTSDNGMLHGEHRYVGKNLPYEESIRVPLIAWCPARCEPGRVSELVTNLDVTETIAQVAGHEGPFGRGRSLIPLLAPEAAEGDAGAPPEGETRVRRSRAHPHGSYPRPPGETDRRSHRRRRDPAPAFEPQILRIEGWRFVSSPFTVFNHHALVPSWTAWRGDQWKFIEWEDGFLELYDLEADPHELVNRIENPYSR